MFLSWPGARTDSRSSPCEESVSDQRSEELTLLHRDEAGLTDHDVVDNNPEAPERGTGAQLLGELHVHVRRLRVAARVVVYENHAARAARDGRGEYFPRVDVAGVDAPFGDDGLAEQPAPCWPAASPRG